MRKIIFGAVAALFMFLAPADMQAQVAFFYEEQPEMALDNENVEFQATVEYLYFEKSYHRLTPKMCVRVKNKTDKMLYIDLGSSFLTVNDEGRSFYIPSSSSTTEGRSSGAGINLGLVNFGGGTSSSETTTTFAQRVVAIPPMSAKNLEPQPIFIAPMPEMAIYIDKDSGLPKCRKSSKKFPNKVPEGETRTFGPDDSPLRFSTMITCAFDEGCTETFTLRRGFYVDRTACYDDNATYGYYKVVEVYTGQRDQDDLLKVFPEWHSWGGFFLVSVGLHTTY